MPKYFLHQVHMDERIEDLEGAEYADLEEARREALIAALEMMSERVKEGRSPDDSRFEISDRAGRVILVVPFSEATK